MAHLITGYAGSEHIKSADDGSFNASFFGEGCFVMEAGNQMDASIIDNNHVRVLDGDLLMHGRHVRIEPATYEDMTIETGTAGQKRIDLVVMEYEKDASDGTESASLKVIKGTPTAGNPAVPSYTDGDILAGSSFCQMPLYKVTVNGVVLEGLTAMFKTVSTFETMAGQYAEEFEEACRTHLDSLNILDTMEEVNANTQPNQLAGAIAVKTLGGQLVAGDGEVFRYAYNSETGQHGIRTNDGTFRPFGDTTKLREALRFSGLDVDNMTDDEIYEALALLFPEVPDISYDIAYSGSVKEVKIVKTGLYKLEVWGAQGGDATRVSSDASGGNGGYSVGYVELKSGQNLYVCVGGKGGMVSGSGLTANGGYNGGGSGKTGSYADRSAGGGGGATHIATTNRGVLTSYSSYKSEVLIVAGGGGGGANYEATHNIRGRVGGGLASDQTGGGSFGVGTSNTYAGSSAVGGSGGGWAGGSSVSAPNSGKGGTGNIDNVPIIMFNGRVYDSSTESGVNLGNGKAKITLIAV